MLRFASKLFVLIAGLIMGACFLCGCQQEVNASNQHEQDNQSASGTYVDISHALNEISIVGAGQSGIYNMFCKQLSSMFPAESAFSMSSFISNGSLNNIEYLSQGSIDLGIVQADLVQSALLGKDAFKDNSHENLRAVTTLFDEYVIILTNKREIDDIKALKGNRISIGAINSGNVEIAKQLLSAVELDENVCTFAYEGIGDTLHSLMSKNIDAAILVSAFPLPLLFDADHIQEVSVIRLSQEEIGRLCALNPFLEKTMLPEGSYPFIKAPYSTIKTRALLMAHTHTEPVKIQVVLHALYDSVQSPHLFEEIVGLYSAEEAFRALDIPIHDAARTYFNQRAEKALPIISASGVSN